MSVSRELQQAIYDALVADAGVGALIADRIYDARPEESNFPCVTFGPTDSNPDDMDCISGLDEVLQLDAWSRDSGRMGPCKDIIGAVKSALHLNPPNLATHALGELRVIQQRCFLEPDGKTAHGVIVLQALLEER